MEFQGSAFTLPKSWAGRKLLLQITLLYSGILLPDSGVNNQKYGYHLFGA